MKHTMTILMVVMAILSAWRGYAAETGEAITIIRRGATPSVAGSTEEYTGTVFLDQAFAAQSPARAAGIRAAFTPGSRSAWHTNPHGEVLLVTSGKCLAQEENGPIEIALPGDVLYFPANVKHWYGAAPESGTSALVVAEMKDGRNIDWLDQVTDSQYAGESVTSDKSQHIVVARVGSQATVRANPDYFTGPAHTDPLFGPADEWRTSGAVVTFEPCSRTGWHTHPMGQILVVTSGRGFVQEKGGVRHEIVRDDIAITPPDVMHWHGAAPQSTMSHLALTERVADRTTEWGEKVTDEEYGAVNTREMPERLLKIALISALTASGDMDTLRRVLVEGLEAGLTVNQIKEVLIHDSAYAGFPRALNGINAFIAVMDEREKQGIQDEHGPEATPVNWQGEDKYRYGHKVLADLRKTPGSGAKPRYEIFTPTIEVFLKEHLFADIFARDTLNYLEREIATVGALSNLPGANAQFRSHIGLAMTQGATEAQMRHLFTEMGKYVGAEREHNAKAVLDEAVKSR